MKITTYEIISVDYIAKITGIKPELTKHLFREGDTFRVGKNKIYKIKEKKENYLVCESWIDSNQLYS